MVLILPPRHRLHTSQATQFVWQYPQVTSHRSVCIVQVCPVDKAFKPQLINLQSLNQLAACKQACQRFNTAGHHANHTQLQPRMCCMPHATVWQPFQHGEPLAVTDTAHQSLAHAFLLASLLLSLGRVGCSTHGHTAARWCGTGQHRWLVVCESAWTLSVNALGKLNRHCS